MNLYRMVMQRASSSPSGGPYPNEWFTGIFYGIMASMALYMNTWYNLDNIGDQFKSMYDYEDTFDFIIVGAGSSGSVVAKRLSENYKVLLLEEGGEPHPFSAYPGFAIFLLNYIEIDWSHMTVPQSPKSCLALKNQQSGWSQGRGLGGTSNINFLIYSRGNPMDFDNWAEQCDDPNWAYDNVVPHFKKSEDYGNHDWLADDLHGHGGEIRVEIPHYKGMGEFLIKAGEEMGYKQADLNGRFTEGFDYIHSTIKNGRRAGTFRSFIKPIRNRENLHIYKFSHVNRVLFRGAGDNEAFGVEYDRHGSRRRAFATKEIILSAGAIQSPKLLMLSGIGPKEHLEEMKIPVRVDSPGVGKNLQDHISTFLGPFFINSTDSLLLDRDLSIQEFMDWHSLGSGVFSTSGCNSMGFVSSSMAKANGQPNWPDIQLIMLGVSIAKNYAEYFARGFHVQPDILSKYYEHALGRESFQIITSLARPKSRGDIKLSSNNPHDSLKIDPKYLDHEDDVKVFVEGIKKAVEIVEETQTFGKIGAKFTNVPFPGCENVTFRSDEYWECFARQFSITLHHIVGTCKMGKSSDPEAVVDTQLKVRGVDHLRVIDSSIMPNVVVGNTNAVAIMIGEAGSEFIKKQWDGQETLKKPTIKFSEPQMNFTNSTTTIRDQMKTNNSMNDIDDSIEIDPITLDVSASEVSGCKWIGCK